MMPTASGRLSAKGRVRQYPAQSNRRSKPCFSTWLYRERNLIERFFSKAETLPPVNTGIKTGQAPV
jgi:transposase